MAPWPRTALPTTPWTGAVWIAAASWHQGPTGALQLVAVRPIMLMADIPDPDPHALLERNPTLTTLFQAQFSSQEGTPCCPGCGGALWLNTTLTGTAAGQMAGMPAGKPWTCPACATQPLAPDWRTLTAHGRLDLEQRAQAHLAGSAEKTGL